MEKLLKLRPKSTTSKLKTSSHTLEIERCRHTNPVTPIERLCNVCHMLEDGVPLFITMQHVHRRAHFPTMRQIETNYSQFVFLKNTGKLMFLL